MSVADVLPIAPDSGPDLRMDYRWIDLRDEKKVFMFKIASAFEKYAVEFFDKEGFINIHTPKITTISSEGGSEVFEMKYFDRKAYLTQSPQLYKQMSMMAGFDKTFEIGELFRSNPSFTNRHATEFTCIDVEISFIESHHDVMDVEENMFKYIMKGMKEEYGEEYKRLFGKDMIEMNYEVPRALKGDLDPDGEKLICEWAKKKYGSDFVFITDFPFKARAFYTMHREDNPELSKSYDLLFKGLEITSGAQREHRYEQLKANIIEQEINPDDMKVYLDFFRYGAPTHGGFGLGLARTLAKLFDMPNVRDVIFIFRGPNRLTP